VSIVDNGKYVKKCDELCRLDSSQLEEIAREEEIAVAQARSSYDRARVAVGVAGIALNEYQNGLILRRRARCSL